MGPECEISLNMQGMHSKTISVDISGIDQDIYLEGQGTQQSKCTSLELQKGIRRLVR